MEDSSEEDLNSRVNFVQPGENDVDGSVKTHRKMVTHSQTHVVAKDRRAVLTRTALDECDRAQALDTPQNCAQ